MGVERGYKASNPGMISITASVPLEELEGDFLIFFVNIAFFYYCIRGIL